MSQHQIAKSLELLEKDWSLDPVVRDFMLGRIPPADMSDHRVVVGGVVFHVPYIASEKRYVLWTCHWPDCHNCCDRQGRLPLTSDDLITIGRGLRYQRPSDFVKSETLTVTHREPGPSGQMVTMTTVNLKRKVDETEADDGTHISCRFLDDKGGCSMHPDRPGVCYLYPFSTWLENEGGRARVHASYQLTGDCPGFYLGESLEPMKKEFEEYSGIIYDYNMASNRTNREGLGAVSIG